MTRLPQYAAPSVGVRTRAPSFDPGTPSFDTAREAEWCRRSLTKFVEKAWHTVDPAPFVNNWHVGAICEHLQAITHGQIRKLIINCPPGFAKCVRRGSVVEMLDGTRRPIEDLRPGDGVVSSDGVSVLPDRVVAVVASGRKKLLRITLEGGQTIDVTPEHRLYGWDDWVAAQDLVAGDGLCVPAVLPPQSGGLSWRKIESIEEIGSDETYDIQTERHNAFFCNGILSHNSTFVSVMWPAWEWVDRPGEQSIFGSYDINLALRDSVKCRRVFTSSWYQNTFKPQWKLLPDQNAKGFYVNSASGNRYTIGMNSGGATGWRGNKVALDDPNNVAHRYNARVKAAAYDTFNNVISTRINDPEKSSFLVIQQRMATDDMTGMLLAEKLMAGEDDGYGELINEFLKEEWVHLKIPMVSTSTRCATFVMGRQFWQDPRGPGELLHESRWPAGRVAYYRKFKLGEEGYAGQFQQEPTPDGGSRFKEEFFQHWYSGGHGVVILHRRGGARESVALNRCWTFVTVDFAASEEQQADWTVFSTWVVTPRFDLLLYDVVRGQWAEPKIIETSKTVYDRKVCGDASHVCFVVEDNGIGMPIRQAMQAAGVPVLPVFIHRTDKYVRSATAAIRLEAGQVFWPNPATPWYSAPREGWKEEITFFPAHSHDDQVDTFSLAAEAVYVANVGGLADATILTKEDRVAANAPGRGGIDRPPHTAGSKFFRGS